MRTAVHHGYEVQICDNAEPYHRTGAIYSLANGLKPRLVPCGNQPHGASRGSYPSPSV
jgi:hypothetical protein